MPGAGPVAVGGQGDVDGLVDEHASVTLGLELGVAFAERLPDSALAAPTRWPAAARAAGGRAPISRLASAIGDRSPACASRASFKPSRLSAAAIAASAASTAASMSSGWSAATSTGSNDAVAMLGRSFVRARATRRPLLLSGSAEIETDRRSAARGDGGRQPRGKQRAAGADQLGGHVTSLAGLRQSLGAGAGVQAHCGGSGEVEALGPPVDRHPDGAVGGVEQLRRQTVCLVAEQPRGGPARCRRRRGRRDRRCRPRSRPGWRPRRSERCDQVGGRRSAAPEDGTGCRRWPVRPCRCTGRRPRRRTTASAPAASAVRRIVPRLPGSFGSTSTVRSRGAGPAPASAQVGQPADGDEALRV